MTKDELISYIQRQVEADGKDGGDLTLDYMIGIIEEFFPDHVIVIANDKDKF
jgi:hypothetical protein